jgi:hypothetical protein
MPATEADIIRWQLRCIKEHASELTDSELKLVISFEGYFNRKGYLTINQAPILTEIYERRTR